MRQFRMRSPPCGGATAFWGVAAASIGGVGSGSGGKGSAARRPAICNRVRRALFAERSQRRRLLMSRDDRLAHPPSAA